MSAFKAEDVTLDQLLVSFDLNKYLTTLKVCFDAILPPWFHSIIHIYTPTISQIERLYGMLHKYKIYNNKKEKKEDRVKKKNENRREKEKKI